MKGALALNSGQDTKWTVRSGSMAGAVRLMNASAFYMGRSPECEFVILNDPKCSRKHAFVHWTSNGCEITSSSENNKLWVNGKEVSQAILCDNDIVRLGETDLQFNLTSLPATASPGQTPNYQAAPAPYRPSASSPGARPKSRGKQSGMNMNRLLIYGAIGLVLWLILSPNDVKKKKEITLRTEQQIQAEIDAANKLREAAEKTRINTDPRVAQRQAQENYVKGFRDYRKNKFERALEAFQACLALQPEHILCNRYYRLSQRKFDELIQYHVVLGRKYRDQNQFNSCRSAFRNVMVMVKDSQSPTYKEAKANYEACNALVEGRF